jgi:hypothetical protein
MAATAARTPPSALHPPSGLDAYVSKEPLQVNNSWRWPTSWLHSSGRQDWCLGQVSQTLEMRRQPLSLTPARVLWKILMAMHGCGEKEG